MNPYTIFNNKNNKNHEIEFLCPSCGNICKETDDYCDFCSYELIDYKNNIFIAYKYYNEAIDFALKKDYIEALISISKFLAYYPNDEEGNKFYIFLLYKNNFLDKYKKTLEVFEGKFIRNPWVIQVEMNGIESYNIPHYKCNNVAFEINGFSNLILEYTSYRTKNIKDIIKFINDFYDIVRFYKNKNNKSDIVKFYETNFLKFVSNREINLESHDGIKVNEMTNEKLQNIEIISKAVVPKKKKNTIVTIYPGIFLRKALISKEKVVVNISDEKNVQENKKVKNREKTKK